MNLNTIIKAYLYIIIIMVLASLAWAKAPIDYVNPQIDTVKSRWFFFSSACRPFGMVNLSPDTDVNGSWNSGYLYNSKNIRCFSHIHAWQLSGIPVMPGTGDLKAHLGLDANMAKFRHDDEVVRPGYHRVILSDRNIQAELTSTCRVGFHRYQFPASKNSHIAFNLDAKLGHGPMAASSVNIINNTEISGSATMAPTDRRKKPCTVYFYVQLSKPFNKLIAWEKGQCKELDQIEGNNPGFALEFETGQDEFVLMKLGMSYVSCQQARINMETELDHWDFDRVVRESNQEWNTYLSRIMVEGGSEQQKIKFYTDLWHALQGRRIMSDVDGQYIDNTGDKPIVRRVRLDDNGQPLYPHHNFDALWGAHWSINTLWSLVYPEIMDSFCNTMVDMYENGGLIPRGPSGGNYTFVMIGDPASSFFACAYNKGIRNYDIAKAYEGLRKNAFPGGIRDHAGYETGPDAAGGGMKYYVDRGYVPLTNEGKGGHREGAAQTMEYAYQDWSMAQLAKSLGNEQDYMLFSQRASNYKRLFDPQAGKNLDAKYGFNLDSGWIRPREIDGSWYKDFQPIGQGQFNCRGFVESNSAIYSWFVPHDLAGLAELMGGNELASQKLNRQFEMAAEKRFVAPHGGHSANWIDYENQPSTAMAHIVNYLGKPWLSQYWVRRVKNEAFGDISPYGGYNGDEDQGQMGALGVLMAIGLFDMQGGVSISPAYELTSPVFDKIVIKLNQDYYPGENITINCNNNSPDNVYIQNTKWNGLNWNSFNIDHSELSKGGVLDISLGAEPYYQWGNNVYHKTVTD
ncbi:MAG: GH92 family glycosyl hydrolase [Sedimentisphaerales bacterium]|nr:GH92 family glycosyl hydrolase [Sedimentisphaerales bacterium]